MQQDRRSLLATLLPAGVLLAMSPRIVSAADAAGTHTPSVKDFGAVGDGVADDTAAFRAACARAGASANAQGVPRVGVGIRIRVPGGTYRITAPIPLLADGIVLEGDGLSSVLHFSGKGRLEIGKSGHDLVSPKGVQLRSLRLVPAEDYKGTLVVVASVQKFTVDDVWVGNATGAARVNAFLLRRFQYVDFRNSRINVNGDGVTFHVDGSGPQNEAHVSMSGCELITGGDISSGIASCLLVKLDQGVDRPIREVIFSRCLFAAFARGNSNAGTCGVRIVNPNSRAAIVADFDSCMFENSEYLVDAQDGAEDESRLSFRGCTFMGDTRTSKAAINTNTGHNKIYVETSSFINIPRGIVQLDPVLGPGNWATGVGVLVMNPAACQAVDDRPFLNQPAWRTAGVVQVEPGQTQVEISFPVPLQALPQRVSLTASWAGAAPWLVSASAVSARVGFGVPPETAGRLHWIMGVN